MPEQSRRETSATFGGSLDPRAAPVSQPSSLGSRSPIIPDHELLRVIGRGSYGEVWLARNVLGQLRAVKIVYRSTFEDDRPFEREFEGIRRFEPISRSHPSQLNILHVGRGEGCFYYVMELADQAEPGPNEVEREVPIAPRRAEESPPYQPRTLKLELKRRGRLPPGECVEVGLALTTALAHLHSHGLVHRDIKPSNIIFVGGVPKLADIGLVTDVDASRSFVGTEGYIPPEGPGTPQADLYSLGKVLYEMSTGRDRKDYPLLPPDWDGLDPAEQARLLELNEVLVKVCEADPRRRYQTAEELQGDLELLQRDGSVRQKRAAERRSGVARRTGLAAALLVTLGVGGFLIFQRVDPIPVAERGTGSLQAYNEYQLGRFFWGKRTGAGLKRAINHFHRAIELDSKFARAYIGLADCYNLLAEYGAATPGESKPKAREAARRALALDDNLAAAHASLAKVLEEFDYDWEAAEREYKRAIELDPNYPTARHWYGLYLDCVGRSDEAIAQIRKALELDPLSLIINANLGYRHFFARRYDEAIDLLLKTSVMDPTFPVHSELGWIYKLRGMHDEAITVWQQGLVLSGESPETLALLREAYRTGGMRAYLEADIARRRSPAKQGYESPCFLAFNHAHLGQSDEAMLYLESAYRQRDTLLTRLHVSPICDPLRSNPRFEELFRKMGLAK